MDGRLWSEDTLINCSIKIGDYDEAVERFAGQPNEFAGGHLGDYLIDYQLGIIADFCPV